MLKLYSYFRSSASFRVRIVLNLKQLSYETVPIHLIKNGGEQHDPDYLALNPSGVVPSLEHNGKVLTQSNAICEYLNELHPEPALLPTDIVERAWVRSVCNLVAGDIHPLNNLRVLTYLTQSLEQDETQRKNWYQHWIKQGFDALEGLLSQKAGNYCWDNTITLADAFVIPQIWNANRFKCSMTDYPLLRRIYNNAMQLSAFQQAAPEVQPDTE
ncbi:MAG: maleylacetoacetate isomerase [Solimicrobium sp.]|jgi:maleylacetoacetate isomerase|nr:maleylacetoacetate isomerase [Solimicrobium sp.]